MLAILATVLGVAAPSLSRFFGGRALQEETRRFLALTRHGSQQAISEGIPMILWFGEGEYGLRPGFAWPTNRHNRIRYRLAEGLAMETEALPTGTSASIPLIRFLPDGSIGLESIGALRISGRREGEKRIVLSDWRLRYEIADEDEG